jgi:signal transduction histidine kinase
LTTDDPERALLAERILAEQEERRRLAELLHDGPVQQLAAIAQMLDAGLADLAAGETERASDVVSRGLTLARDAARDLRALCDDLEPRVLHQLGFTAAAAALARRISSRHEGSCSTSSTLDSADAAVALYQILREALERAVRRGSPCAHRDLTRSVLERWRRARRHTDDGPPERRATVLRSVGRSCRHAQRPLQLRGAVPARLDHPIEVPPATAHR